VDDGAKRSIEPRRPSIAGPGLLLGVGLGGFVDGILLHQILQWHHMLSSTDRYAVTDLRRLKDNTFADGLFHASTWIATAVGVCLLWRATRRGGVDWDSRSLLGWVLAGWGLFNVVEGLVDHHLLKVHHVRDGASNYELYDATFLTVGVALLIAGIVVTRAGRSRPPTVGHTTIDSTGEP
jgi:uncharacterized membrane protein